jgi:glutamine phosphoribosylpyrophosphate amidotransferase
VRRACTPPHTALTAWRCLARAQIHNGNLTNAEQLRATLQTQSELSYQRHLRTDSDSEVLLNIFADEIHRAHKARGCMGRALHVHHWLGARTR